MSKLSNTPSAQGKADTRRARLSVLASAPSALLLDLWSSWLDGRPVPDHVVLRAAEIGTVMVRGRAGAKGAPFNLGEMTVTRASIRLAGGTVGHGHVQGRCKDAARAAALIDALAEADASREMEATILGPLRAAADARRHQRAAKAAETKVEFFTMVRGET